MSEDKKFDAFFNTFKDREPVPPCALPISTTQADNRKQLEESDPKPKRKRKSEKVKSDDKAETTPFSIYPDELDYLLDLKIRLMQMRSSSKDSKLKKQMGRNAPSTSLCLRIVLERSARLGLIPDEELEELFLQASGRDGRRKK